MESTARTSICVQRAVTPTVEAKTTTPFEATKDFQDPGSALKHLDQYIQFLNDFAVEFKAKHDRKIKDQDVPSAVIRMVPPHPTAPPLLVIGGMGPLAGALAMQQALEKFGDEREIVLVQLCQTPDRTDALEEDRKCGGPSEAHHGVVQALADGFAMAQGQLSTVELGRAHMVVACNTAHNFVPDAFKAYQKAQGSAVIDCDSLIESVSAYLKGAAKPVLILGTDGTRKTSLYTRPLTDNGVHCMNLDDSQQKTLGSAIYEGVKAFNPPDTLKYGQLLFNELESRIDPEQGCIILSACTEVPEILDALRQDGSDDVKKMLAGTQIVDPVTVTLDRIAAADVQRVTAANEGTFVHPGMKV